MILFIKKTKQTKNNSKGENQSRQIQTSETDKRSRERMEEQFIVNNFVFF